MPPPFQMAQQRRQIVRSCKQRGWTIQPLALQGILEQLRMATDDSQDDNGEQDIEAILDKLDMSGKKTVTSEMWKELADNDNNKSQKSNKKGATGTSSRRQPGEKKSTSTSVLTVVNAYETPKLIYEVMRKHFYVEEKRYSLFGTAEDKTNMLCQRYALIHQRVLRNDLFRPKDLTRDSAQHKLTPIESLLGKTHDKVLLLLGILLQIEEGMWYLEDPTGQVPISFQSALIVDGFFVTEQCVLLVEGSFHDGIFYVSRLGQPCLEVRDTSISAIQQHVSHPAFFSSTSSRTKKKKSNSSKNGESFVILSDVHLDQPRVLQQLESLFAKYEKICAQKQQQLLPVFVLMGNFSSSEEEQSNSRPPPMEELASLIATCANLAKHAHFVLVPGPNDTLSQTLPFANTLPRTGFSKIQHVHWATNPCRIRSTTTIDGTTSSSSMSEMVIFRYELLHLMQRQQLLLQEETPQRDETMESDPNSRKPHARLIKTILDQGHLCPVAGVPIAWNYDHALSLYPLPHVLVLGGDGAMSKTSRFHEVYEGCHVIHPGSITADGSYAVYNSCSNNNNNNKPNKENDNDYDDEYDDDDDDNDDGPRVEFFQLGVDK